VNAYTLVFGGFLLLGGRAGDLLGRKRLFLFGLVVFTAASLLDGLAVSPGMLIGSRALQGLGAAFISPAALAIITTTFHEGAERAKALGVWAAIAIGGSAVGLVVGGALTQLLSWPWIFFINVPVGVAVLVLSLRYLPESRDEEAHRSFDIAGAVSITAGLMTLVYAIVQAGEHGWTSARTLGLFAMFFFNTLYIQRVLGYGPLEAGLAFLPFTAGIMVSAGFASKFTPRLGVRPVAIGGMIVTIAGMMLLTRISVDGSYASDVLPALVLTALGLGAVFVPLTLVATTGLENEDQGLASGIFNTSQQIGGALGLAILASLAASKTASATGVSQQAALVEGFHVAFAGGAAFMVIALGCFVALLRRRDVERIEAEAATAPIT